MRAISVRVIGLHFFVPHSLDASVSVHVSLSISAFVCMQCVCACVCMSAHFCWMNSFFEIVAAVVITTATVVLYDMAICSFVANVGVVAFNFYL